MASYHYDDSDITSAIAELRELRAHASVILRNRHLLAVQRLWHRWAPATPEQTNETEMVLWSFQSDSNEILFDAACRACQTVTNDA